MMNNLKQTKIISVVLLFLTALLWGSGFSIRKMALAYISPLFFNSLRFFIGFVLVLIFYLVINKGKINPTHTEDQNTIHFSVKKQVLGASMMGIMLAVGSAFQQTALLTTTAGKAAFLTTLYTIMVPLLMALVLRTKVQLKVWICAVLAVVGIYLVGGGFEFSLVIGDLFAILCALSFAVQVIFTGYFAPKSDGIFLSVVQMLVASLGNFILSLFLESGNSFDQIMAAIWPLLYSAIMALALPYTFQILGQKHTKASVAAIVLSLESVFGAIFGALILKEMISLVQVAGCALIFTAIIITQIGSKNAPAHEIDKRIE